MFVVTGTPRSATGYASMLFRSLGIPCSHERIFRPRTQFNDVVHWCNGDDERGDSSWLAWVFLPMLPREVVVLHTIRDPWAVVDSLAHRNHILNPEAPADDGPELMRAIIKAYAPRVYDYDTAVDRAACMVLDWNRAIHRSAMLQDAPYRVYRVEDLGIPLVRELCEFIGIPRSDDVIAKALTDTPLNVNRGSRVEYNIKVTNPSLIALLKHLRPDIDTFTAQGQTRDIRRDRHTIEASLAPELRRGLNEYAIRFGYAESDTQTERVSPALVGVSQ
jgi:hypothetical protein